MNKREARLEELDVDGVARLLVHWEMQEFTGFVREKQIDGRNLLEVTEGVVKLWRPKANAKKFLQFIAEVKLHPEKYLKYTNDDNEGINKENTIVDSNVEAQYQTVNVKRIKEHITSTSTGVEEILKKIVPAKSFLYRHQSEKTEPDKVATSYVPMNAGTPRLRKYFRLSSFTYPDFDRKHFRLSKAENFNDRGYYQVKTISKTYIQQQKISKKTDSGTKYKSLTSIEDLDKFPDEHFYEDLNYYDMDKVESHPKETNGSQSSFNARMVKIHDMFTSFKLPFLKRSEDLEKVDKVMKSDIKIDEDRLNKLEDTKPNECDRDGYIYENSDSVTNMYDSIHVNAQEYRSNVQGLPVEDYLEPVQLNKDYCDVAPAPKDDSILRYILNIFEHLSMKRETTDMPSEDPAKIQTEREKPLEEKPRSSMADRPLPVPVKNEPYFMNIDRTEAENLLRGHPDGTFILRPSSQPDHAYTLSVSCANAVHNVGVRRRQDGRLALGFARRGERSFDGVTSLLRHHRKQRLLLVAGGSVCGATALIGSPEYYQTPKKLTRTVE
ncbi:hypothetical protein O0L34_g14037 [Tuta absoluta]|nr:hypothetical protein O0L34_g14037 [Tuta absoluta]